MVKDAEEYRGHTISRRWPGKPPPSRELLTVELARELRAHPTPLLAASVVELMAAPQRDSTLGGKVAVATLESALDSVAVLQGMGDLREAKPKAFSGFSPTDNCLPAISEL